MEWITEGYPQEEGDFLWVSMWSCHCCVHKSGVAWVHDVKGADDETMPPINYTTADGKHLGISWEGTEPPFLDKEGKTRPQIDGWLKVDPLPDCKGRLAYQKGESESDVYR